MCEYESVHLYCAFCGVLTTGNGQIDGYDCFWAHDMHFIPRYIFSYVEIETNPHEYKHISGSIKRE